MPELSSSNKSVPDTLLLTNTVPMYHNFSEGRLINGTR